ncbi:MAG TPA: hypothetical protein VGB56_08730 [Flavisolibacter sp.]
MKKFLATIGLVIIGFVSCAQKVESIHFNLYTDSLKKGFYNYISVDAKYTDGTWQPLDSGQIILSANTGSFKGNDLFIDSTYKGDSVRVRVVLKKDPALSKEVVIYIRKRGFDEPLKTNDDILNERRSAPRKRRA